MTKTHTYRGIAWIDMVSPDDNEISGIVRRYDLHPLVGEELKSSTTLAKIDFYENYVLVVLTLPSRVRKNGSYVVIDQEIDFVIGDKFLITSRQDTIEQLEYFAKIFDTNSIIDKNEKIDHAGSLFYYMIKKIYAGMFDDLENIRDALLSAETKIFAGGERPMVRILSNISRERRACGPPTTSTTARISASILRWCAANAVAVTDPAGNRKLDKKKSNGRIDGLVSLVMACGMYARLREEKPLAAKDFSGSMVLSF